MTGSASADHFLFEGFRLDHNGLFKLGETGTAELVALGSRALDLLRLLVERRGQLVSKDEIIETVWQGIAVEEANLTVQVSALRRVLDQARKDSCIQTVSGRGYRFVAAVAPGDSAAMAPPLPDKPSIAVLPFANISGDPQQEYFADGMVEEIVTALSRVHWLFVIARTSSFAYKGRAVNVKQVGRELGVRYLLEGSVRKTASRLRVSAQLVETASGNHIWAERYDREPADIFAVQDEIAEQVVAAIEPPLYAAEHFLSQRKPPESLDAWECLVRAMSHMSQGTIADTTAAEELCRRAIALAPDYAQAHSLLSWAILWRANFLGCTEALLPEATSEARTAMALDEQDPWSHFALGRAHHRDHRAAQRAFRRAVALNPNFALAHSFLGLTLAACNESDAAIEAIERALRLMPGDVFLSFHPTSAMAIALFSAGRYAESVAWARRTIERRPDYFNARRILVAAAAMNGDLPLATEALAELRRLAPNFSLARERRDNNFTGDMSARLLEGLHRAGVPEM
jgi:TolB-like protein